MNKRKVHFWKCALVKKRTYDSFSSQHKTSFSRIDLCLAEDCGLGTYHQLGLSHVSESKSLEFICFGSCWFPLR